MNCKASRSDVCWFHTLFPLCFCLLIAFVATGTVNAQAGLALSVTKSGPGQAYSGGIITFTIDVQAADAGPDLFTETITLTDTLPGGIGYMINSGPWQCGIGNAGNPVSVITLTIPLGEYETLVCERVMADGTSESLVITGTVNTSNPAFITNTVTVAGSGGSVSDSAVLGLNPPELPVPTLNEWSMLVFSVLLAVLAVVYLRSRRET